MDEQLVEDLLHNQNYAQALKHVTKRLKKAPRDNVFLAYKSRILLLNGEINEAFTILKQLADCGVTNSAHVQSIHDLLHQVQQRYEKQHNAALVEEAIRTSESLWKTAIKLSKTGKQRTEFISEWITQATESGQWSSLVQATLAMEQDLAKTETTLIRNYWFWQILARWQAGTQSEITEKTKSMHRMLAGAMIQKAFSSTPTETVDSKDAGKWIATRSEMDLFGLILRDNPSQLLDLLKKKELEPSVTSTKDRWGAFALGQQALYALKDTGQLQSATLKALQDASQNSSEDWRWEQLQFWTDVSPVDSDGAKSLLRTSSTKDSSYLLRTIEAQNVPRAARVRLATIAIEHLSSSSSEHSAEEREQLRKLLEDQARPDVSGSVPVTVFKSLLSEATDPRRSDIDSVVALGAVEKLLSNSELPEAPIKRVQTECFKLELVFKHHDHTASIANPALKSPLHLYRGIDTISDNSNDATLISNFVKDFNQSLRAYLRLREATTSLLNTDVDPANEALLIAVECTHRLALFTASQVPHLLGLVLLCDLVQRKSQDPKVRSLLVNKARALGLNSLANRTFAPLRIKGISFDKCYSHYFQRIASLSSPSIDNIAPLDKCLKFFVSEIEIIPDYILLANENGNYKSAHDFTKMLQRLRQSSTRALTLYEKRRLNHLRGSCGPSDELEEKFLDEALYISSDKKVQTLHGIVIGPEYAETTAERYALQHHKEEIVLPPPFPTALTAEYLTYLRITDVAAHQLIYGTPGMTTASAKTELEQLVEIADGMRLSETWLLTTAERTNLQALTKLARFVSTFAVTVQTPSLKEIVSGLENLSSDIDRVKREIDERWTVILQEKETKPIPAWEVLQTFTLDFEFLRGVVLATRKVTKHLTDTRKKEKSSTEYKRIEELVKQVSKTAGDIWGHRRRVASDWLNDLNGDDGALYLSILTGPEGVEGWDEVKTSVLDLIDERKFQGIVGGIVQSSVESLEGVLRLKIDA